MLVATAGCQSSYRTFSDKTIQLPALDHGAPVSYHILRTNMLSPDRIISVRIGRGVHFPGTVKMPKGATLLEAIAEAGGFTDPTQLPRFVLTQPEGTRLLLKLHRKKDWRSRRSYAWFGEGTDWVLENGSAVEFPMNISR